MPSKETLVCYFGCPINVQQPPGTFKEEYLEYEVLEDFDELSTFDDDPLDHTEQQHVKSETQLSKSELAATCQPSAPLMLNSISPHEPSGSHPITASPATNPKHAVVQQPPGTFKEEYLEFEVLEDEESAKLDVDPLDHTEPQHVKSETQLSTSELAATCRPSAPIILNSILFHEPSGSNPKHAVGYRKHFRAVDANKVMVTKLKRKLEKLTIKYKNQRKQLLTCRKVAMSLMNKMTIMDKLPQDVRTFTKLQLKGALKPRGRRFTSEEKTMALTILKESPTAFQLLRSMFVLPSKRSLRNSKELKSQNVSL